MSSQEIVFRVVVDDAGVPAATQRTQKALAGVGQAGQVSAAQTAAAMRTLPAQFTDIVTQLQGGASPFTVLLQQGGQIKDSFGGIGPAARAMVSAITPATLAFGALALAGGGAAAAFVMGREEAAKLTSALALNGGAAGRSRGQIEALATTLGSAAGGSITKAREAFTELAGTGAFTGATFEAAGRATVALQRISGQSAADIVKDMAGMRNGVAAWALEADKTYRFLSTAQYSYVRELETQGRAQEAARVVLEQLAGTMESRTSPAVGFLEQALQSATGWWDKFWNAAKGAGKPETAEDRIKALRETIAAGGKSESGIYQRGGVAAAQQQLELELREAARRSLKAADTTAEQQKQDEEKFKLSQAYQASVLAVETANEAQRLAVATRGAEARRLVADAAYRERTISAEAYTQAIIASERARLSAELQAAEQEKAIIGKRTVEGTGQQAELQRQANRAAEISAQTKIVGILAKRDQLEAKIKANAFRVTPDAGVDSAQAAFRRAELAAGDVGQRFANEQRTQAYDQAHQLLESNRAMNAELIVDDRARGLAQIAIEEDQLRKRLNLAALSTEDRKRVDDDFATWRLLREQQLTRDLKPQWQKDAELWADTVRDMKQRYDTFMQGFVDQGRTSFQQWFTEGKVTTSGLTGFIRSEFLKLVYERYLSGYVRSAAGWLFGSLLGGGSSGGGAGTITGGNGISLPGKASGGPVMAGGTYWVGERGPEILRLGDTGGTIVPNHALGGMGGMQLVQNFTLRGNEDSRTLYAMATLARDSAVAAVADARRRGNTAFVGANA